MKDDGSGNAVSKPTGLPNHSLSRDQAITKCADIGTGYKLIKNDEWQAIARNIENVTRNWSSGTIGSGEINKGHTDGSPWKKLEATAVDGNACFGTNQTCSGTTWHHQRRTHFLSNGEVIWDLGGNISEWVKEDNWFRRGSNYISISQITATSHPTKYSIGPVMRDTKGHFGPGGNYSALNRSPYGGFGLANLNANLGAINRGGSLSGSITGIFSVSLTKNQVSSNSNIGFRCTYKPSTTN